MNRGLSVVAEVVSFDAAGFVDHDGGFAHFPSVTLLVTEPSGMSGSVLTLVLDSEVSGAALLAERGARVRLLLDPEAAGLDPVFAGALLDGAVHPAQVEEP